MNLPHLTGLSKRASLTETPIPFPFSFIQVPTSRHSTQKCNLQASREVLITLYFHPRRKKQRVAAWRTDTLPRTIYEREIRNSAFTCWIYSIYDNSKDIVTVISVNRGAEGREDSWDRAAKKWIIPRIAEHFAAPRAMYYFNVGIMSTEVR